MQIKAYKQCELAKELGVVPRTVLNKVKKDRLVKVDFVIGKKTVTRYLNEETSDVLKNWEKSKNEMLI